MDRRAFLTTTVGAALATRARPKPGPVVRIGILSTGTHARIRHAGALLGVEEAQHAAELFGGAASLVSVASPSQATSSLAAVIGDESLATSRLLAKRAANGSHLFMNVECASDLLRGAECASSMFHVAPSDAMMRDARARLKDATDVTAWDPSLFRFGADTLNDRFRKRFGTSMTAPAWGAWFAVKVIWESSLRMKTADPRQLAEFLERDTTQFDGHKGRPLSFRAWDHQLRQFLYARVGGKLIDVPRSATSETMSREFLDELGATASATTCHFAR